MDLKREARGDDASLLGRLPLPIVSEPLTKGSESSKDEKKEDEKISLFWRVFGGTILTITALVIINAYQSLLSGIRDVRGDLNRANEMLRADMTKADEGLRTEVAKLSESRSAFINKDEYNSTKTQLWAKVQELSATAIGLQALRDRLALLEDHRKILDTERKDLQALQASLAAVRERLQTIEANWKTVEADHKLLAGHSAMLKTLQDKSASRDVRMKQIEQERRELALEVQQLRERLAKLEGAQEHKTKPPEVVPPTASAPVSAVPVAAPPARIGEAALPPIAEPRREPLVPATP